MDYFVGEEKLCGIKKVHPANTVHVQHFINKVMNLYLNEVHPERKSVVPYFNENVNNKAIC